MQSTGSKVAKRVQFGSDRMLSEALSNSSLLSNA